MPHQKPALKKVFVGLWMRPGRAPDTRFSEAARAFSATHEQEGYAELMQGSLARMRAATGPATSTVDVATAVWRAATDAACPLHIPAGADAQKWAAEAEVQSLAARVEVDRFVLRAADEDGHTRATTPRAAEAVGGPGFVAHKVAVGALHGR